MAWRHCLLILAACGDNLHPAADAPQSIDGPQPIDAPPDMAMPDADPRMDLVLTGLCLDEACTQISPDVTEYTPLYPLWSDGATKRRWFKLPPGTKIDTSDMSFWVFPVGTKFWKEFTRDGKRVETRFITKEKDDDDASGAWFYITFAWNDAETSATPTVMGADNVLGTQHDIPNRAKCKDCHESTRPGRVLGFQAIQLDHPSAAGFGIDDLIAQDLLTVPPAGATAPHFSMAGFSAVEKTAFTYLHANCGTCHNPHSATHDVTPLDLRLDVTKLGSAAVTPTVLTTVNVDGMTVSEGGNTFTKLVIPHDVTHSIMSVRMNSPSQSLHMPKVGSELVDPDGQTAVSAWINSL